MSKSAIKTLANARGMARAAGVELPDLVEFLNDGKSRTVNGCKLWRNADLLACLIVNSIANCFQTETADTLADNGYSDMAAACCGYIAANLDTWSQMEWATIGAIYQDSRAQLDRLVDMVNAHIEYTRKQEMIQPIKTQIGYNNKRIAESENENEITFLSNINMGLREMVSRIEGNDPDYRIMPSADSFTPPVSLAKDPIVMIHACQCCAGYLSNGDDGDTPIPSIRGAVALQKTHMQVIPQLDSVTHENNFKCECCKIQTFGDRYKIALIGEKPEWN